MILYFLYFPLSKNNVKMDIEEKKYFIIQNLKSDIIYTLNSHFKNESLSNSTNKLYCDTYLLLLKEIQFLYKDSKKLSMPTCEHIFKSGSRKGSKCTTLVKISGNFCSKHKLKISDQEIEELPILKDSKSEFSAKHRAISDKGDREKGLNSVIQSINKINFKENDCKLILETMVGRGGVLGVSFEELSYIYNRIEESKRKYIGICIDTCHIFAEGLYKLDSVKGIDKLFEDFQRYFTLDKLSVIHLNDSKCEYNSKADRHSTLMNGCIWKRDILKYFVSICERYNIPMILETEESDYDVVENL